MRTLFLSIMVFYTSLAHGQNEVVINVNDIKLKWKSDTIYGIPVSITNCLDSSIFVIDRPIAFKISYNFAGDFSLFFSKESKLNSNAGPDAITICYLVGPSYEEIKPGHTKKLEVRIFTWDFKRPKDYQIQFKYSLKTEESDLFTDTVKSNSFNLSFY